MKLVSVRVQNYKCIEDSEEFSIRDLTCLAGKNESGKTALLQALRRLNPVEDSEKQFNELMEYPRRRRDELRQGGPSSEVLTTEWELSVDDIVAIEGAVRSHTFKGKTVIIKHGYHKTEWIFAPDAFLPDEIESSSPSVDSHQTAPEPSTRRHSSRKSRVDPQQAASSALQSRLPRFLYFPTYGTLPGRVSVENIANKQSAEASQTEGERLFLALLALAGTDIEELSLAENYEDLKAKLEIVSNQLSREIFAYWTQNRDLQVEFDYREALPGDEEPFNSGHVFNLRIANRRHGVTVGFDERSTGFVWFFSFLVWFSQMEQKYGDKLIILLDEPGLSLHGKAQGDLLRYIKEKLLTKYQVLYTTHSPFMIDTDNILSVRTVEDVVTNVGPIGTKVGDKVLSADADTLFPLRAALGYDITQSLFVGEHSLLVEGSSDLLFLRWFSRQLTVKGRAGLDSRWTVTPVGGIDKLGSFNALFGANELHVAILTDFHSGDKRKVRELGESGLLQAGHVFSANQFTDLNEADIEDMLGRNLYINLVNRCYALTGKEGLPAVRPDDASTLVLEEVKQHFRTVATSGPEFDHLSPAVYLVEHESDFSDAEGLEDALDRFEKLFQSINALLPQL